MGGFRTPINEHLVFDWPGVVTAQAIFRRVGKL